MSLVWSICHAALIFFPPIQESWQLRKGISDVGEEVDYDEELYVAGNMVVWSKGSKNQASAVYKAFTVDSSVLRVRKLKVP